MLQNAIIVLTLFHFSFKQVTTQEDIVKAVSENIEKLVEDSVKAEQMQQYLNGLNVFPDETTSSYIDWVIDTMGKHFKQKNRLITNLRKAMELEYSLLINETEMEPVPLCCNIDNENLNTSCILTGEQNRSFIYPKGHIFAKVAKEHLQEDPDIGLQLFYEVKKSFDS